MGGSSGSGSGSGSRVVVVTRSCSSGNVCNSNSQPAA